MLELQGKIALHRFFEIFIEKYYIFITKFNILIEIIWY